MNNEKLMVLKLVDDGKITADEAVKLIKALGNSASEREIDLEDKLNRFSQSVDCFAKDSKERVENFAKDVEPRFKNVAKVVIEKTASMVDDLSKVLKETVANINESVDKECNCDCGCEEEKQTDETKVEDEDENKDEPRAN